MRLLLVLVLFAAPLAACLWDYDTLAQESRGMGDIKAVIAGGFPRNPPLYYEMRLERVTKVLAQNPDDLDAYDAAGVACDRLGRADEAIAWMDKKQAAMQRMGYDTSKHEQPNHSYRHKANLGTFYAHRWFSNGAMRENMDDLKRGRELIAEAIKEYPNAHFGREKYQLMVMDWVLRTSLLPKGDASLHAYVRNASFLPLDRLDDEALEEALKGLTGLILMGQAWESVDVVNAIRALLESQRRAAFAYFVELRVRELVLAGRRSVMWSSEVVGADLVASDLTIGTTNKRAIEAEYQDLRREADSWHEARTSFMLEKLSDGKHPDTDQSFWTGFDGDPESMPVPSRWLQATFDSATFWTRGPASIVLVPVALALVALTIFGIWRWRRGRKTGTSHRSFRLS